MTVLKLLRSALLLKNVSISRLKKAGAGCAGLFSWALVELEPML
jgi:hypothetical protein